MKISAWNAFKGTIKHIEPGTVTWAAAARTDRPRWSGAYIGHTRPTGERF